MDCEKDEDEALFLGLIADVSVNAGIAENAEPRDFGGVDLFASANEDVEVVETKGASMQAPSLKAFKDLYRLVLNGGLS